MPERYTSPTADEQFEALLVAAEARAATLAGLAVERLKPGDRAALTEQLRYIANLIESAST